MDTYTDPSILSTTPNSPPNTAPNTSPHTVPNTSPSPASSSSTSHSVDTIAPSTDALNPVSLHTLTANSSKLPPRTTPRRDKLGKKRAQSVSSHASTESHASVDSVKSNATISSESSSASPHSESKGWRPHILPLHTVSSRTASPSAVPRSPKFSARSSVPGSPVSEPLGSVNLKSPSSPHTHHKHLSNELPPHPHTPQTTTSTPTITPKLNNAFNQSLLSTPTPSSSGGSANKSDKQVETFLQELANKNEKIVELRGRIKTLYQELQAREKDFAEFVEGGGAALSSIIDPVQKQEPFAAGNPSQYNQYNQSVYQSIEPTKTVRQRVIEEEPSLLSQTLVSIGEQFKGFFGDVKLAAFGEQEENVVNEKPRPRRHDTFDLAERGERKSVPSPINKKLN